MLDDTGATLEYSSGHERLRLEAWGEDSIRVRASQALDSRGAPWRAHRASPGPVSWRDRRRGHPRQREAHGSALPRRASQLLALRRRPRAAFRAEGALLVAGPRLFVANGNGHYRIEQRFKAYDGEKLYGLGQHLHGRVRSKGPRHGPGPAKLRRSLYPSWSRAGDMGSYGTPQQ